MPRLLFLCARHSQWLEENPDAAADCWLLSYSRSIDLLEQGLYPESATQAGAAFECAAIGLTHSADDPPAGIRRFTESGVLLAQLLYRLGEARAAASVVAAAVGRLETLLLEGVARHAVLEGCQRLLRISEALEAARRPPVTPARPVIASAPQRVH
jgi:hypothetical protein